MVYRVLGRLLWRGELGRAEILIIHRGAPGDIRVIQGSRVTRVKRSYLVYRSSTGAPAKGREVTIPLHRVLEVRRDGRAVWKRAGKA